ncbi:MAG: hypothetical protein CMN32_09225 [Saprospirales bacterium]|nr:hypothetical protein [Saprospirales bacterium]
MDSIEIKNSIIKLLGQLSGTQLKEVLSFLKDILRKNGTSQNKELLDLAGTWDEESLIEMEEAIKDCEKINYDEW